MLDAGCWMLDAGCWMLDIRGVGDLGGKECGDFTPQEIGKAQRFFRMKAGGFQIWRGRKMGKRAEKLGAERFQRAETDH
jgi:hypothetical protein